MSIAERITVHEAELVRPRERGRFIYAFCHIHGSDHQRSLHINSENGFGKCHSCGAQVFVPELNPDGARIAAQPRRVTAETLLRPRRIPASEPEPEGWQRDELETLTRWYPRTRERLQDERARAYLAARSIPYDVADGAGVGYIPADARLPRHMAKWRDRLVFPLASPAGPGFYGRSLHGWAPGRDVNEHAAWLKDKARAAGDVKAWGHCHEKTYPAGWWNYDALAGAEYAVICEGAIDALALVAANLLADVPTVALMTTAARAEWIPANVRGVVLGLDGDAPGMERTAELARDLRMAGLAVMPCAPVLEEGNGKDWAERWRLASHAGVWAVSEALDELVREMGAGA